MAEIIVTLTADSGSGSLCQAIDVAQDGAFAFLIS